MFKRRNDQSTQPAATVSTDTVTRDGVKGRPTPTRKEAEAARMARVRPANDRKALAQRQREQARAARVKTREAMSTGDERYYSARDKGPVRRFVRDFVDSRRTIAEFFMPLLLVILVLSFFGGSSIGAAWASSLVWLVSMALVLIDLLFLGSRIRKQAAARFPDENRKGVVAYGVIRATQMRFLRMPKPQVKPGAKA